MRLIYNLLITLSIVATFGMFSLGSASAISSSNFIKVCSGAVANNSAPCQEVNANTGKANNPVISVLKSAIELLSYVTGIAAVILIIISGIQFVTSNGDSNGIASARNTLIYALIGLGVAALAQIIVVFVLDKIL